MLWGILKSFTWFFAHKLDLKGFESGQYGDPPSPSFWGRQAAVYVMSLLTMKLLVLLLVAIAPFLSSSAEWLLGWFGDDTQVVLYVYLCDPFRLTVADYYGVCSVMGIFPCVLVATASRRLTADAFLTTGSS